MSEFLDSNLKSIIQKGVSYNKETIDFQDKIKNSSVPKDAFLVIADVFGLYPNNETGLKSPKEALERRAKNIYTKDLVKMPQFMLKNNYFESDRSAYQQMSGTTNGTLQMELKLVFRKHKI